MVARLVNRIKSPTAVIRMGSYGQMTVYSTTRDRLDSITLAVWRKIVGQTAINCVDIFKSTSHIGVQI